MPPKIGLLSKLVLLPGLALAAGPDSCSANAIAPPDVFGTKILSLEALEIHGYNEWSPIPGGLVVEPRPVNFCNITITYTHPGWNDAVHVYVWLPLESYDWNGNFFALGGGGWAAGREGGLVNSVALGYASANTDAGHDIFDDRAAANVEWALHAPGVVNLPLIHDFGYLALDDMTKMAKAVTKSFYGSAPKYSYWAGCSTGGRQGMVQAQRYPENYDGILSVAPTVNWATFVISEIWGQLLMNEMGVHPPVCEFEAITTADVEACDELDGVRDGVVGAHAQCQFDPTVLVGTEIVCNGKPHKVSQAAADLAKAMWQGPTTADGRREWYGMPHGAAFMIPQFGPFGGLMNTQCSAKAPTDAATCRGRPFVMAETWIQYFLKKDPSFDVSTLTKEDFFTLLHQSRQEWTSVIDTSNPDLSRFKTAGGKIIHWHGVADQLIPVNNSLHYYERVEALDADVRDFYRYFEAPGVTHCAGGNGPFPVTAFDSLVDWVEHGKAPDRIEAVARTKTGSITRPLCPYPLVAVYKGGDATEAASFECKGEFGAFGFPEVETKYDEYRDEL